MAAPCRACIRSRSCQPISVRRFAAFLIGIGRFAHALGYFEWMIEIFGIVKDPLASVARDNLVVAADFLEDLRADAHLTDFADFISSGGNRDSSPRLPNAFVSRDQIGRRPSRRDIKVSIRGRRRCRENAFPMPGAENSSSQPVSVGDGWAK